MNNISVKEFNLKNLIFVGNSSEDRNATSKASVTLLRCLLIID